MIIIIVHELGHVLVSQIFKWNIDKIIILPFGGLTKFNEIINRPLIEEFLIAIAGIIFQIVFYLLLKKVINYKYFSLINYFILLFNLIPIYPLDGSKILNVLFNKLTNFKNSLLYTVIVSYTFIIILSVFVININKLMIIVLSFLFIESNKLYKERKNIFNKFLLERYLNDFKFKKEKTIKNINNMKKDYRHILCVDNKYLTEKSFLKKMFDIK